ncbi:HNH endonuclease [Paenibacillus odorifer]|uniref:HNH endonuclease n=1 Tax=Paenibacillus odorifer TaxID=189426 RepID=UPI0009D66C1C|nr:HNH endonuclease [Paenibacillus odorifer]
MLVENVSQILHNIAMLEAYKNTQNHQFYNDIIKKGKCIIFLKSSNSETFAPSRFVGYFDNGMEKHLNNFGKHGGDTNIAIRRILGKEEENERIEEFFLKFCDENKIVPENKIRKYWTIDVSKKDSQLINDILELESIHPVTTRENFSLARIGQGRFRSSLIDYWGGCAITKCKTQSLLKASHIKPWKDSNNFERLDVFNGILLMPNYDTLFDKGLITFSNDGIIVISRVLSEFDIGIIGLRNNIRINFEERHLEYLSFHKENVFER